MTASPTEIDVPSSFRDLIARWSRTRDFARDAGCSPLLVRQWRHRNFVPPQYWRGIVAGALRRQIGGVDAELLARLAASLRGPVARTPGNSPPEKSPPARATATAQASKREVLR
jgi:hypothetical protein